MNRYVVYIYVGIAGCQTILNSTVKYIKLLLDYSTDCTKAGLCL